MAGTTNNGVVGYISNPVASFPKNSITIDIFGNTFYRDYAFGAGDDTGVYWNDTVTYSSSVMLFLAVAMQKSLLGKFSFGKKLRSSQSDDFVMLLPITKTGEIDFDFMESFVAELEAERVAELEAYLSVTGLKNYELTEEEKKAIECLVQGDFSWKNFEFTDVFNQIKQGRRLKKSDQLCGNIPFVMAGVNNTGVVNYISNPVAMFPQNTITIDIFGNTFYRNYAFGAGDDTGVYWNDTDHYSQKTMLFFATAMAKSVAGKFSFGKKLRSSKSLHFKMQLPANQNKLDYEKMELLISAVQKLVIKDVVLYADQKIDATKKITQQSGAPSAACHPS